MPDLDDLFAKGSENPSEVPAKEPATANLDLPDLDDLFASPEPQAASAARQALNFLICPTWTACSEDEP